jgi:hypothetical protein
MARGVQIESLYKAKSWLARSPASMSNNIQSMVSEEAPIWEEESYKDARLGRTAVSDRIAAKTDKCRLLADQESFESKSGERRGRSGFHGRTKRQRQGREEEDAVRWRRGSTFRLPMRKGIVISALGRS